MSFHNSVKNMIRRYGSHIKIESQNKTIQTKAFIQPLKYKNNAYSNRKITVGGFTDSRYYLYIGYPQYEFSYTGDEIITCDSKKYVVHNSELFSLHNKGLYVWAVLRPYKGQRRDDYDADSK